jgi:hypothetical protein
MLAWTTVVQFVLTKPVHQDVVISRSAIPHPSSGGFVPRLGDFQGQSADFGLALSDNKGIHVREYADRYAVHWDFVDPSVDPVGHLIYDAPHWLVIGAIAGSLLLFGLICLLDGTHET